MRRGIVAALLATVAFAACSSFEGDDSATETRDAGIDTAAPAVPSDAGSVDADPDSGPLSFCQQKEGALFCDDFEQPGRTFEMAAPWDALTGERRLAVSIGPGYASTAAARFAGVFGDGEGRRLQKVMPFDGRRIRWSFRLLVTKLDALPDAGSPEVFFAAFQFANGKYLSYALSRQSNELRGTAFWNLDGTGGSGSFLTPPVGLRFNDWMDVRVEYEPLDGVDVFRFYVGDEVLSNLRLDPGEASTLSIGVSGKGPGALANISYDDVVVETF